MGAPERDLKVKSRAGSVALLFALAAMSALIFMYWPVREVRRTGQSFYSFKGVVLVALLLYLGILMLCGFDHTIPIRVVNARGKRAFTRRGWLLILSLLIVGALSYWGWIAYLHAIGIDASF